MFMLFIYFGFNFALSVVFVYLSLMKERHKCIRFADFFAMQFATYGERLFVRYSFIFFTEIQKLSEISIIY